MRTFKLATLLAVVGLTAACGSSTTTAPTIPLSSDEATVSDATASSLGRPAPLSGNCRGVLSVTLERVPHPHDGTAEIVASYQSAGWERCTVAPAWKANRPGLLVYDRNRFRAEMPWRDNGRTTVYASAPNGVTGKITF